jgi:hypothetical protein
MNHTLLAIVWSYINITEKIEEDEEFQTRQIQFIHYLIAHKTVVAFCLFNAVEDFVASGCWEIDNLISIGVTCCLFYLNWDFSFGVLIFFGGFWVLDALNFLKPFMSLSFQQLEFQKFWWRFNKMGYLSYKK